MSIKPEELRPCPFCGRNLDMTDGDTLHPNGVGWTQQGDYRNYDRAIGLPKSQWCYVACCSEASGGCGAEMSGDSRQEAIDKWNARAIPDTHCIMSLKLTEKMIAAAIPELMREDDEDKYRALGQLICVWDALLAAAAKEKGE